MGFLKRIFGRAPQAAGSEPAGTTDFEPGEDPNEKMMLFVESSRMVLSRAPDVPRVRAASASMDRIEALVGGMRSGRLTQEQMLEHAAEIIQRVNDGIDEMAHVRLLVESHRHESNH